MDEKDLKRVIAESMAPVLDKGRLEEAYVTQPKTYTQMTELVSEKTKDTHVKIYHEYVEELNRVSAELDTANRVEANTRHSSFKSAKADETHNLNAVWLHELYFSNCFDQHSELFMDTLSYIKLQRDFGTFEHWQSDFMACGVAADQGWVVCGYHPFLKRYINVSMDHKAEVPMGLLPVIVVDVNEHAYFRDYLKDRKSYIVAMMKEFNWEIIEERFKKCEKFHEANR